MTKPQRPRRTPRPPIVVRLPPPTPEERERAARILAEWIGEQRKRRALNLALTPHASRPIPDVMRAEVIAVRHPFFAVELPGGFTVVELIGGDVDKGEVVSGDFESLGGAKMRNETRRMSLSVFVQDYGCTREVLWATFKLRP